jgi:large subunit ribosomal protein L28
MQPKCQLLSLRLSTPRVSIRTSQVAQRAYATDEPAPAVRNPLRRRKGGDLGSHLPKNVIPQDALIPAYPYGDHALFKQANRGLYGHQMIQFGNNVSVKTETKTRRYWKPNVLSKSLYSVALKKKVKLRITASVLKTMDREGGLDEYLLKDNEHRLKELGPLGWALRWTLLQKPVVLERMRSEAAALGLDQATIDAQWPTPDMQRSEQRGLVTAAELIGEETEEFDDELAGYQEEEEVYVAPPTPYKGQNKLAAQAAIDEYNKATKASARYLARDNVDSEEAGLKLAFIRAKERREATAKLREDFAAKLDSQFTSEELEAVRARLDLPDNLAPHVLKKIAYNQQRRQEINESGSYEAWREHKEANARTKHDAKVQEAGGLEAHQAQVKEMYAQMIAEAETAFSNKDLDADRRAFLDDAIKKAERAIIAKARGGVNAYVDMTVEAARPAGVRKVVARPAKGRPQGDAWAELVEASNQSTSGRVSA